MEKLEFLKKLPIFFNLKDEEIISVLKFFKYYEESFKKNDFIFEIERNLISQRTKEALARKKKCYYGRFKKLSSSIF